MAKPSELDIINAAMAMIGHSPLTSLTTKIGAGAKQMYTVALRSLISAHPWNFATRETELTQLATLGSSYLLKWKYAYSTPVDMLRLIGAVGTTSFLQVDSELAGSELYSDEADGIVLRYVSEVGAGSLPAYFVDALVHVLASQYARSIADNTQRASELIGLAMRKESVAKTLDAQQGPPITMEAALSRSIHQPTKRR